jgi:thiosulfate reductase cytochrome b subunit
MTALDVFATLDARWPDGLAAVFGLAGLLLLGRGLRWAGLSLVRRGGGVVGFLEGFRLVVAGLVLLGLAAAWVWQSSLLLFLALGIGFVELLESTVLIAAMKRDGGRVTPQRA